MAKKETVKKEMIANFDGTIGVTVPTCVEWDYVSMAGSYLAKIPSGLKCKKLDLSAAKDAVIQSGLECERLWLDEGTINLKISKNVKINTVDLSGTDGAVIPSGLECEELDLCGAENFKLPKKLKVGELNLVAVDDVIIPSGLECKKLVVSDSPSIKFPDNLQIDTLELNSANFVFPFGLKCNKVLFDDFMIMGGSQKPIKLPISLKNKCFYSDNNGQPLTDEDFYYMHVVFYNDKKQNDLKNGKDKLIEKAKKESRIKNTDKNDETWFQKYGLQINNKENEFVKQKINALIFDTKNLMNMQMTKQK